MHSLTLVTRQLFIFSGLFYLYYPIRAQDLGAKYNFCDYANNYTSGSAYERNLNITLSSLASNASLTGFYNTSVGQNLSMVYGLIQCRADISKDECQTCANTASKEITQLCGKQREAFIANDYCSLRFSDQRFFSTISYERVFMTSNVYNATNPAFFTQQLGNLIGTLSSRAASSPSKFASGSINYTNFVNIYAMMQCTRDLEENSCSICLRDITNDITNCCDGKQGGQVVTLACNLRFEVYSFVMHSTPPPEAASVPSPPTLIDRNSTIPKGKKSTSRIIVIVVIAILIACGCFFWRKGKKKRVDNTLEEEDKSAESLLIGLDTLKVATTNFSDENKLGEGGFGPVYKGKLIDGREIAVKRLSGNSGQGLEELKTEVILVAKLLHRNLVRLLGFCLEEKEKLLVYEYLPNGSLDKILFDKNRRFTLEWERRYKIIAGIARGLLYLHEDSQLRIIHRDLKTSNILLDEYMNPIISDFGLARLFGEGQIQGNTKRMLGHSNGYMAPEYVKNGHFSTKSDVYSYGVLILEILTGQKNSSFRTVNLSSYAWQHWTNGTAAELLDPALGKQYPESEVMKCIHIGLLCVQEAAADRPTMSEIVTMLSSYSITSPDPSKPAYFVSWESPVSAPENPRTSQSDKSKAASSQPFVNGVTISEIVPL